LRPLTSLNTVKNEREPKNQSVSTQVSGKRVSTSTKDDHLLIDLSKEDTEETSRFQSDSKSRPGTLKSPTTATSTSKVVANATSKNSQNGQVKKSYKYVAVVRKKDERDKLKGSECEHCKKWYEALEESGDLKNRAALLNTCSRHKHLHSPPTTPPSFWDLDFPTS